MSKQIQKSQEELNKNIESMSADIRTDMKGQIETLQNSLNTFSSNINSEISIMKNVMDNHDEHLNLHDDDIQRVTLLNQLILTGISPTQNENLKSIFETIAKHINYNTNDPMSIPQLRRIFNNLKLTQSSCTF